jgi:hypothetical protein
MPMCDRTFNGFNQREFSMKQSTRILTLLIGVEAFFLIGGIALIYMIRQNSGDDGNETIRRIFTVMGTFMGGFGGFVGLWYFLARKKEG